MVIALSCALAYVMALAIGAFRIYKASASLELAAEKEFAYLVEKAGAAGALGFMDQAFRDSIRQTVDRSETLAAVLVGGPAGTEYAVQRDSGFLVSSVDGPRFATRFDIADKTLNAPLRLDGVRNATLSAIRLRIKPEMIFSSLRFAFFITMITLCIAVITLIADRSKIKGKGSQSGNFDLLSGNTTLHGEVPEASQESHPIPAMGIDYDIPEIADNLDENKRMKVEADDNEGEKASKKPTTESEIYHEPIGLYSPVSGLGWNRYLLERLEAELRRSASFEQDLVLILSTMHYAEKPTIEKLRESADSVIAFFTFRDLAFDWNEYGFALILPNMDLDHGLRMSDEYAKKICNRSEEKGKDIQIRIGLSARAGRLVNAERLIMEAERALQRAQEDEKSPIVAFKPDPERYRNYISSNT